MNQDLIYERLEEWLRSYPTWKAKMETLRAELEDIRRLTQHLQLVPSKSVGIVTNPTLETVTRRLDILEYDIPCLELRIHLTERSLQSLEEEDQLFVKLRYFQKKSVMSVVDRLNLSRSGFFRKRIEVLDKFYELVGGHNALIWLDS